jgi:hypothetical protein
MQVGQQICVALMDWFKVLDIHKTEKIRRAVKMTSRKKRTILDILGSEDCEDYKQEIDSEIKRA